MKKKWRNPYLSINKKKTRPATAAAGQPLAVTPKAQVVKSPFSTDLLTSIGTMRSNLKGISSTIRQMEDTMDTVYGAMEMIETISGNKTNVVKAFSGKSKATAPTAIADGIDGDETQSGASNLLSNIDIGQIISLLQSPLVQSLLTQNQATGKRKKEG